jgi:hypothetical protein
VHWLLHCLQWYYAATTLRSECTGAGQDLMLVAGPESVSSYVMEADTRRCHTVPTCKGHTGPCVSVQVCMGVYACVGEECLQERLFCWCVVATRLSSVRWPDNCCLCVLCIERSHSSCLLGRHSAPAAMHMSCTHR